MIYSGGNRFYGDRKAQHIESLNSRELWKGGVEVKSPLVKHWPTCHIALAASFQHVWEPVHFTASTFCIGICIFFAKCICVCICFCIPARRCQFCQSIAAPLNLVIKIIIVVRCWKYQNIQKRNLTGSPQMKIAGTVLSPVTDFNVFLIIAPSTPSLFTWW